MNRLQVLIEQDEDGLFNASCLGLKGCYAFGESYSEALLNIREKIQSVIDMIKKKNGIDIDFHLEEIIWFGKAA
jgi:predicted RNase H-like HicB family nuclease